LSYEADSLWIGFVPGKAQKSSQERTSLLQKAGAVEGAGCKFKRYAGSMRCEIK